MIYSIYGFGKFKTESAVGITVRSIYNKDKVLFVQFLKDGSGSEIKYFDNEELVDVIHGDVEKITLPSNLTTSDKFKAQVIFSEMYTMGTMIESYKLIVADEILPAMDMGLVTFEQVKDLVDRCNKMGIDLYMTGRIRSKELRYKIAEISDVCTDAHCIRHSFNTHCIKCDKDYKYHYTYCPCCGAELTKSKEAKLGRDY